MIDVYKAIHEGHISYAFRVEEKGIFVYYVHANNWVWYSDVVLLERQASVLGEYSRSSLLDVLLVTGMDEQDIVDGINQNIKEWQEIFQDSNNKERNAC